MEAFLDDVRKRYNDKTAQLVFEGWQAIPEVEKADENLRERIKMLLLRSVIANLQRQRDIKRMQSHNSLA